MLQKIQKKILFGILILVLLLPFIQYRFNFVKEKLLHGAFQKYDKPEFKWFTWKSWFNEKFQNDFNKSLEENIGFKNLLIRINNQADYTLFRKTSTANVVVGKSDCLYEEGYILDYIGQNFVGKDSINSVLLKVKRLQDYLKINKNIQLLIVFESGKASFFPEFIPEKYMKYKKEISNFKYYTQQCRKLNISHLNLNDWFVSIKDTSKFPLFPKYGVHWSTYGMCIAADTIIKYIEQSISRKITHIYWNKIHITNKLKDVDFDIERTLNLLFPLPHETMAYPEIKYIKDSLNSKPDVLVIADSYYWSIFDSKIPEKVFGNHQFWYYNTTIYPDIWGENARFVDHSKDKEVVENKNVILIMVTELNLNKSFFGFIDNLYKIYFSN